MARNIISQVFVLGVLLPLLTISSKSFSVLGSIAQSNRPVQTGIDSRAAWNFLSSFGYLSKNQTYDDKVLESALKRYQQIYHLNVTGKLDPVTINLISTPRCGYPDDNLINFGGSSQNRRVQVGDNYQLLFKLGAKKWPPTKYHLKWKINGGVDSNVGNIALQQACTIAFNLWAKVSQFQFQFVGPTYKADLLISFQGPNMFNPGVMAWGAPPQDGRMVLNANVKNWSFRPPKKDQNDLIWVCIHEIGHLLGIDHSENPKAIMWAHVTMGETRRALHADDIAAIHAMYPR